MKKNTLSNRKSRFELFRYFFLYRKKIKELEFMYAHKEVLRLSYEFLLPKVITEYAFSKRVDSLARYYDKLLFLLMGDYADYNLDKETLVAEYGYPGIPRNNDSKDELPF